MTLQDLEARFACVVAECTPPRRIQVVAMAVAVLPFLVSGAWESAAGNGHVHADVELGMGTKTRDPLMTVISARWRPHRETTPTEACASAA